MPRIITDSFSYRVSFELKIVNFLARKIFFLLTWPDLWPDKQLDLTCNLTCDLTSNLTWPATWPDLWPDLTCDLCFRPAGWYGRSNYTIRTLQRCHFFTASPLSIMVFLPYLHLLVLHFNLFQYFINICPSRNTSRFLSDYNDSLQNMVPTH